MKRSISGLVALLAGAFVAYSQGTVSFGNYLNSSQTYCYVSFQNTLLGGSATVTTGNAWEDVHNGSDWTVALYGNAGWYDAVSDLVQLQTAGGQPVTATLESNTYDFAPGTWYSPLVAVVPNTSGSGSLATVQILVWYNLGGKYTNYYAAGEAGMPTGFSSIANVITGGTNSSGPPDAPALLPYGTGPCQLANINITADLDVPFPNANCMSPPAELSVKITHAETGASGPSSVVLSWPATNGAFTVQTTTNLVEPTVWNFTGVAPVIVNGQYTLTNAITQTQQFFRLVNP